MYYAAGNKLYLYDMAANQSRVIYQFAAGEQITALKLKDNAITLATFDGNARWRRRILPATGHYRRDQRQYILTEIYRIRKNCSTGI